LGGIIYEAPALSSTVGYFVGIGVANMKIDRPKLNIEMVLYIVALIGVILANLFLNVFA